MAASTFDFFAGAPGARPAELLFIDARSGINVSATANEAMREKVTVNASCLNIWPAMPTTKPMGKNTAIVVRVEAVTAFETSPAPFLAASFSPSPSSCLRNMFSITTTALSTNIPMPNARPPRDIIFMESLPKNMSVKATIIEIGMLKVTIAELFRFLKKNSSTKNARKPPCTAASLTPFMESFMNVDWSLTISIFIV